MSKLVNKNKIFSPEEFIPEKGIFYMNYKYDWREAWLLIPEDDVPRSLAPSGNGFFDICNDIKEFFIGLWNWLGVGVSGYAIPWIKNLFTRKK